MAKTLARQLGFIYVDTGAMYRAVTLYCMRNGIITDGQADTEKLSNAMPDVKVSFKLNAQTGLPETYLGNECVETEIRTMQVSNNVSVIAAIPFVREAMVAQQRQMAEGNNIVMDGRDIGTTVFPNAELKIFVTARAEVRAQRRFDELKAKGMQGDYQEILKNVQERDYIDSHREVSPLRQAPDALLLDNSDMTIPQQQQWLLQQAEKLIHNS
jgi:cytidylate kinase